MRDSSYVNERLFDQERCHRSPLLVVVAHRDQVYSRHAVNVNVHELFAGLKMFPVIGYILIRAV